MAKKKNTFSIVSTDVLRKELVGVIEYLNAIDLQVLDDDIEEKVTKTGGTTPIVITTIEKKIKTCIGVIKQSVTMIKAIYDSEDKADDLLLEQIDITSKKLEEFLDYFFKIDIVNIQHRYAQMRSGRGRATPVVVASKDDQIQARKYITEEVAKIVPMLEIVKAYKEISAKGDKELDEAMERYLRRNGKL